jgi:hypothetical protein
MSESAFVPNSSELIDLRWAERVNDVDKRGLYGPTVRRQGHVNECGRLFNHRLLNLVIEDSDTASGYWITPLGRQALSEPT